MPFRTTRTHRQVFEALRDTHFSKLKSRIFDSSYIAANTYNEKFIYPGLVVAINNASEYVPYNAAASYGAGSDTAIGMMHTIHDLTYGDKIVSPIWHGVFVENYCYVYGGALGTVPAAVKTALDDIEWT